MIKTKSPASLGIILTNETILLNCKNTPSRLKLVLGVSPACPHGKINKCILVCPRRICVPYLSYMDIETH